MQRVIDIPEVIIKRSGDFETALKSLRRRVQRLGVLRDLKDRHDCPRPVDRRKLKKHRANRRRRKKEWLQQGRKEKKYFK